MGRRGWTITLFLLLSAFAMGGPRAQTGAGAGPPGRAGNPWLAQVEPTEDEDEDWEEPEDTLDVTPRAPQPTTPPEGRTPPAAAPDTAAPALQIPVLPDSAAPLDTLRPGGAPLDTLVPRPAASVGPTQPPPKAAPKERTGVFGIHPAAILIGLAALHYFVIRLVRD